MSDEPAFQIENNSSHNVLLTKRELFAALAMQGLLANTHDSISIERLTHIPNLALIMADKLLADIEESNKFRKLSKNER